MALKKSQMKKIEALYRTESIAKLAKIVKAPRVQVKEYLKKAGLYENVGEGISHHSVRVCATEKYGIDRPSFDTKKLSVFQYALFFVLFLILSGLVYANSLKNAFVFDDNYVVVGNYLIQSIKNVPKIFGFGEETLAYRPLRTFSYVFDFMFFQLKPYGYRLFNIFYHAIVGLVVFCCAHMFFGKRMPACIAVAVFLLHPVQTDSVSYISGRRDILVGLFYFLGFFFFVKAREENTSWLYVCTCLCYVIGYFAKEMVITLPLVCCMYDVCREEVQRTEHERTVRDFVHACVRVLRARAVLYTVMGCIAVGIVYHTLFVAPATQYVETIPGSTDIVHISYHGGSAGVTVKSVFWLMTNYCFLLLWPAKILCDYSFNALPLVYSVFEWRWILSLIVAILFFVGACVSYKRDRNLFFSLLWFLVPLIPVSQIVPHHELFAVHYLYISVFSIAYALGYIYLRIPRKIVLGILVVIVLLYSARTMVRNLDWKSEMSLYKKNIEYAPESVRSHLNLGRYYAETERDFDKALAETLTAIELDAQNPVTSIEHVMRNNLGNLYVETGQFEKAEKEYRRAIELWPNAQYQGNLASLYGHMGLYYKSIRELEDMLEKYWNHDQIYMQLALQYFGLGRLGEAEEYLRKSIQSNPYNAAPYYNLSVLFERMGRFQDAEEAREHAVKLEREQKGGSRET